MDALRWEGSYGDSFVQKEERIARIWWDGQEWRATILTYDAPFEYATQHRERESAYLWAARMLGVPMTLQTPI